MGASSHNWQAQRPSPTSAKQQNLAASIFFDAGVCKAVPVAACRRKAPAGSSERTLAARRGARASPQAGARSQELSSPIGIGLPLQVDLHLASRHVPITSWLLTWKSVLTQQLSQETAPRAFLFCNGGEGRAMGSSSGRGVVGNSNPRVGMSDYDHAHSQRPMFARMIVLIPFLAS